VAGYGDDNNPGTLENPFLTIQQAADTMVSGDICYIRQGLYHEAVSINNQDGMEGSPIVFTNYSNERVAFDGSVSIDSIWQLHSGNIWKTTLDFDIWQLFVDRNEMVMARWPNANFENGSIWDKENHWGHGTIDQDPEAYENGTLIDEPHGDVDLAGSGLDITEAIAILNVGSFKTWTRRVLTHSGNTFTYDPVPGWKTKHHDYFLEGKLEFLDAESEWFFNPNTKELYFWAPNGMDPNNLQVRGKVQSYAFEITNSDHIQIKNLEFFGTTFKFTNSDYGLVEGCNLYYPSCYRRMLGVVDTQPEMSIVTSSSHCKVSHSAFRYTDGSALEMYSGYNTIEDCYFFHIDYTATDLNGLMTTIQMGGTGNIFRRNTLHKMGASATLNPGNEALIELNDMSDSGYMQSDGALVQCMVGQQPGVEIRYNWLHDTIKYGARFDGNGDGNNGLMHHNLIWNVVGGIMVKGYEHNLFNNTAFDNGDKNDIIVMIEQGGNEGTITRNNAANKIAGHRTGSYQDYPVPGIYDHNWNGYETGADVKNLLIDPENFDFRPHPDSALVDGGVVVEEITDGYLGDAPDLGAYEYGGEYWIPGITWDVSATFGDGFDSPEPLYNGPVWYVSTNGSDGNDGSEENPFSTIQFAFDRATDHDTILVHPGIYNGTNWFIGKSIVLGSLYLTTNDTSYIYNTIIDGDSSDCTLAILGNIDTTCRVTGFTIQNGIGCVYGQGAGIYIEGSSPRLDHLVIRNNHGGTNGGGICLNGNSYSMINEITIENNSSGYGGGIYCYSSEPTITNCTIRNNQAALGAGLYLATANPTLEYVTIEGNHTNNEGGGIYCTDYSIPTFKHLTIVNNIANGGGGIYCAVNSNPTLLNSILWNDSPDEIIMSTGSLTATYSNIEGGWEGTGNINQDPLFCFADGGIYTLAENSPCVGTGENGVNIGALGVGCETITFAPVLDIIADQEIIEDSSLSVGVSASSYMNLSMSFSATSDTTSVSVSMNDTILTATPDPDWNGTAGIMVIVIDENELSDTTGFILSVTPVNDSPADFSIIYPEYGDTVVINLSNQNDSLTFQWEESTDPDGDSLVYLFDIFTVTGIGLPHFTFYYTDTLLQTHLQLSYAYIADSIVAIAESDTLQAFWWVYASDGLDSIFAQGEPGIFIDAREYLAIDNGILPDAFMVYPAYPNPFNPVTTLRYDLPEDAPVNITIYDMMGRQVKTLINNQQSAGSKLIRWSATNQSGRPVSAGLYLYRIQAGKFNQTRKVVLLK